VHVEDFPQGSREPLRLLRLLRSRLSLLPETGGRWRRGPGVTLPLAGSHAGSYGDEQSSGAPDSYGQRASMSPRLRTDLNGSGCQYRNLRVRRSGRYDCLASGSLQATG
jgi:hypothetical protein